MRMLDLFCGTKSVSNSFLSEGWDVFTVDFDPGHSPDLCIDILEFDVSMLPWKSDVVWASPDCRTWSVASCARHWTKDKKPKTDACVIGIELLNKTLDIIEKIDPTCWFIENPRGMMRKYARMEALTELRRTVTYCQYGDTRMKPTDIWSNCAGWHPRPMCHNGDPCHEPAPRGSNTGTQGLSNSIERARIPLDLCNEIVEACVTAIGVRERDITDDERDIIHDLFEDVDKRFGLGPLQKGILRKLSKEQS